MYNTLIVPLDGSDLAEKAIAYARLLAARFGAPVVFLRIMPDIRSYLDPYVARRSETLIAEEKATAAAYVLRRAEGFREAGLRADGVCRLGDAASEIIAFAEERPDSLLVMSTHGRGGLNRWLVGSVAEKVVRASSAPVFLVPADAPAEPAIDRVLVPLDRSELAAEILPIAAGFARALGATIVLFQAYLPEVKRANWAEREAFAYLTGCQETLAAEGLAAEVAAQRGESAEAIVDYARAHGIDLIAMATHGRGGLARWALGSVADKVVHAAEVPVLLWRPSMRQRG